MSKCRLFQFNNTCQSKCTSCGRSCQANLVSRNNAFHTLESLDCEVVIGTVSLTSAVTSEEWLKRVFQSVTSIQGDLIISGVSGLTSLAFLKNLLHVENIVLQGNTALVDARLASTTSFSTVSVSGSQYLCPAWYPGADQALDSASCAQLRVSQYFSIDADKRILASNELDDMLSFIDSEAVEFLKDRQCSHEVSDLLVYFPVETSELT
jgi:hypothetical protein